MKAEEISTSAVFLNLPLRTLHPLQLRHNLAPEEKKKKEPDLRGANTHVSPLSRVRTNPSHAPYVNRALSAVSWRSRGGPPPLSPFTCLETIATISSIKIPYSFYSPLFRISPRLFREIFRAIILPAKI